MPKYEYECSRCKLKFIKKQNIKDKALEVCPKCMDNTLYRVVQAVGVSFGSDPDYYCNTRKW